MQNSKKRYHKKWSKIETEALKDLYCNKFYSIDEISKILGRTEASVLNKIKSKKFTRGMEFSHEDYDKLFQEKYELMKQDGYIIENGEKIVFHEDDEIVQLYSPNDPIRKHFMPYYFISRQGYLYSFGKGIFKEIQISRRKGDIYYHYNVQLIKHSCSKEKWSVADYVLCWIVFGDREKVCSLVKENIEKYGIEAFFTNDMKVKIVIHHIKKYVYMMSDELYKDNEVIRRYNCNVENLQPLTHKSHLLVGDKKIKCPEDLNAVSENTFVSNNKIGLYLTEFDENNDELITKENFDKIDSGYVEVNKIMLTENAYESIKILKDFGMKLYNEMNK